MSDTINIFEFFHEPFTTSLLLFWIYEIPVDFWHHKTGGFNNQFVALFEIISENLLVLGSKIGEFDIIFSKNVW